MIRKPHLKPTPREEVILQNTFFKYARTIINTETPTDKVQRTQGPALKALLHVTGLRVQTSNTSLSMNETKYHTPPHSVPRSLGGTTEKDEKKKRNHMQLLSSKSLLSEPPQEFLLNN